MPKKGEVEYFKNIGSAGIEFGLNKPYSDRINVGLLLSSIATIFTFLNNEFGEKQLKIVDLGCGVGWSTNMYALSGHEVMGVDLSKEAIAAAKQKFIKSNL